MQAHSTQLDCPIRRRSNVNKDPIHVGWYPMVIEKILVENNKKKSGLNAEFYIKLIKEPKTPIIKIIFPIQDGFPLLVSKSYTTLGIILDRLDIEFISDFNELVGFEFLGQLGWNDFYCLIDAKKSAQSTQSNDIAEIEAPLTSTSTMTAAVWQAMTLDERNEWLNTNRPGWNDPNSPDFWERHDLVEFNEQFGVKL